MKWSAKTYSVQKKAGKVWAGGCQTTRQRTTNSVVDLNLSMSIITFNINGLSPPIKRQTLSDGTRPDYILSRGNPL